MQYIIYESAISSLAQDVKQNSSIVEFVATMQEADVKNRNGRIYPRTVIEAGLNGPMIQEKLRTHSLFGECGHPYSQDVNRQINVDLKNAAFRIDEFWWDGNLLKARCKTLDTSLGRDMAGMIREGCELSFSMRGQGNVVRDPIRDALVVQSPLMLITYDWVYLPSHEKAYMDKICEETKNVMFNANSSMNFASALNESINLFENGKLINLTPEEEKKISIDYSVAYQKSRKTINECYKFDKNDKIKDVKETSIIVENGNVIKTINKDDYLLKSIRDKMTESLCGIAPVDRFECDVCMKSDLKGITPEVESPIEEKELETVKPIENTDAVEAKEPEDRTYATEACANEAATEPNSPAIAQAKELGVDEPGVAGEIEKTALDLEPKEEPTEDTEELKKEFAKVYTIVAEESGLTEEKEIMQKALEYRDFMTEECAYVFETLLKSED